MDGRFNLLACAIMLAALGQGRPAAAAPPAAPETPAEIKAVPRGHGWTFTDARGMTLYTYANDEKKPNGSLCVDQCAQHWPPVLADAGARPVGLWGLIVRDDGARQWALNGRPVYRYADDPAPGAAFGDGHEKAWRVAEVLIDTPPTMSITTTVLGRTLATKDGRTLYRQAGPCTGACLRGWQPLPAPAAGRQAWDEWSVLDRRDGTFQWMYRGAALFTYDGDFNPREVYGHGRQGVWQAAVLEPAPPTPSWVKPKGTDAGEMLGNADGLTIYYYVKPKGQPDCIAYKPTCISPDWRPILAAPDAQPVGDWTILVQPDGTRQWGFRGHRLYTYAKDRDPGDFKGIMFGGNRGLKVIMRNGDPLQGVGGVGG